MKKSPSEKTNVMRILEQVGIPCILHDYTASGVVSGPEVAAALHQDPERVFKTLVTVSKMVLVLSFWLVESSASSVNSPPCSTRACNVLIDERKSPLDLLDNFFKTSLSTSIPSLLRTTSRKYLLIEGDLILSILMTWAFFFMVVNLLL